MFTQRNLYRESFYTRKLSHTEVFTQRSLYTEKLLHTSVFTHRNFYTEKSLHREAFTCRTFYTQKLSHREVFTPRRFYTQMLLHPEAFTQRTLYTEALWEKPSQELSGTRLPRFLAHPAMTSRSSNPAEPTMSVSSKIRLRRLPTSTLTNASRASQSD